jgi:hypothetical protein
MWGYYYAKAGNVDNAIVSFEKSVQADPSIFDASRNLGLMYLKGQGVDKDYKMAMVQFKKAANRNYPPAQYQLGNMYLKGQGVKKNNTEARKWFQKAADAGYKNAEKALKSMGGG